MGKYKVISGQSLYDVALHIYGSIEGITDLLICNPSLSMADILVSGQELIYSDDYMINPDVVAYNRIHGIIPANGERNVYYKESEFPRVAEFRLSPEMTSTSLSLSGEGAIDIDWGDNSPMESIILTEDLTLFSHSFDNVISSKRKVRFYGDFRLRQADFTALNPSAVFFLIPVYIEELTFRSCRATLGFLGLLDGLYSLDLTKNKTNNLLPIADCRQLMRLDLSGMDVLRESLDEFLIALVRSYYGRRNCEVILTEFPSGEYREPERDEDNNYIIATGMEAVWLLTNEPAWNEGCPWKFTIGQMKYEYMEYPSPIPGDEGETPATPI